MCGIAGVVGGTGDLGLDVRRMCTAIVHRGPDDDGYHDELGAHLGMRRLAIIDIAHGAQPIANEDSSVVTVFNGEVYNHPEIQAALRNRGHRLATDSDTECLVHLYEDYGPDLVDHLRGMFALAVWDRRTRTLVLARDRAGKKPLYYYEDGPRLWFASELKSLLALASTPRDVDPVALRDYLAFKYVPNPRSILRGIRKLPPAHRLIWRDGRTSVERYWTLQYPDAAAAAADDAELEEQLRAQLIEATRIRMISERPLGAFLSGGLDSSAVVAAMAHSSAEPVRTFSIGFAQEEFNELPHARRVAELYGTKHQELIVEPDVADLLPRLARAFDEPIADDSVVPSYYVAEMAARDVVVALNGDGGDESLGGYRTYTNFLKVPPDLRLPAPAVVGMRVAGILGAHRPFSGTRVARPLQGVGRLGAAQPWDRYGRLGATFNPTQLRRLLRPDLLGPAAPATYDGLRDSWRANAHTDPVNRMLAMDVGGYLPGDLLPKVDITTMAVSLEARSPFLDHVFMEWAAALPGSVKIRNGTTKYLLKQALRPWLPDDLIHRRKMGFAIPVNDWLRGPLRPMVDDLLLDPGASLLAWCRPAAVKRAVQSLDRPDTAQSGQVWTLLMLELWAREVLHG